VSTVVVAHPNCFFLQNRETVLEEIHDMSWVSCDAEEIESTVADRLAGLGYIAVLGEKQLASGC
jgi:hypothetical protein